METVKGFLNFCKAAVFYDYTNIGITCELNQVRKYIINSFYKIIPHTRIVVCLSRIDDVILKISDNDIENILKNIHDLGENILNLLLFEKYFRDDQQVDKPILNDDGQK